MNIRKDYKPRKRRNILCRDVKDGCVLYDVPNGKVHVLNVFAAYIWEHCDGHHSIDEISLILDQAIRDRNCSWLKEVLATIDMFNEKGLLIS
jgi:hypothetical protein